MFLLLGEEEKVVFGRIFYWVVWSEEEEGGKRKGKGRDRKGKGEREDR